MLRQRVEATIFRRLIAAGMLVVCSPAGSLAQDAPVFDKWTAIPGPMPVAYYKTDDGYEVGFVCNDLGVLLFSYSVWTELVDPAVANLAEVDVVFAIDQPDGIEEKSWVTLEPNASGGLVSFSFSGDAVDWALDAMKARRTIHVGLSPHAEGEGFAMYNGLTASAAGSTAAMRPVVEACG